MKNPIETQKEGYRQLINLCVAESGRPGLLAFIDKLSDYNGDDEYVTTLNYVKDYLDENEIHFIMAFDWKQEVDDLAWRISSSLRDNYDMNLELPDPGVYGEQASVSYKNVFKDYDKAVARGNLKLGFIDTNSDEYVLVLHKKEDERNVRDAIEKIGYPYLDVSSRKISNE
ncbi:MAG TPA: hypothetical protein VGD31_16935 [Sphingobacteriaceae bacterium]